MIALVLFLHVCLCSRAATAPNEICNGCGCVVEVLAVFQFGGCNHCNSDSDGTLIKCAGYNMWCCSDVFHRNNNDNNGDSFKYGMEGCGHTQLVDVSSRGLLNQIARFIE